MKFASIIWVGTLLYSHSNESCRYNIIGGKMLMMTASRHIITLFMMLSSWQQDLLVARVHLVHLMTENHWRARAWGHWVSVGRDPITGVWEQFTAALRVEPLVRRSRGLQHFLGFKNLKSWSVCPDICFLQNKTFYWTFWRACPLDPLDPPVCGTNCCGLQVQSGPIKVGTLSVLLILHCFPNKSGPPNWWW